MSIRTAWIAVFALGLAACNQDMDNQPKYIEYKPDLSVPGKSVMQAFPPASISRERYAREASDRNKPPLTRELLLRGRERYDIFCSPCHAKTGDGYGPVVHRGMPHPQSFDSEAMRNTSDDHFFDVITSGYGLMYPLGYKIPAKDRWAIIAYLRALQLSTGATAEDRTGATQ